jgi:hypothetical protein
MAAITVTNAGLNALRDSISGTLANPKAMYVAIGTSNTAPSVNDIKLGNEVFRKAVSSYSTTGTAGQILINVYLAPGDAVGTVVAEVGFFIGPAATITKDSGVLLARGLYAKTLVATESVQLQLDLTL